MTKLIGVYGASGFGREVMPLVRIQNPDASLVFIEDNQRSGSLNGCPVWRFDRFVEEPCLSRSAVIAIGAAGFRERLTAKCSELGIGQTTVAHPTVVTLDDLDIGEGAILCSFLTFTSNIRIGRSFHANIYSYVARTIASSAIA